MLADTKENLHKEHRKRLRKKFMNVGIDGLEDHEIIELLLYYVIPVKDTNETAHKLIKEYGSVANIFDADEETLVKVDGIGESAATMFKLMRECVNKYINDKNNIANVRLTPLNINTYIKNLFYGHTREVAYAVMLDSECIVRKVKKLSSGTVNATPLYPREIVKLAVNEKYPYMLLAHNHPNGSAVPSPNDLKITKTIELALNFVEVRLVDHVIVAGEKVTSLARNFNVFEK